MKGDSNFRFAKKLNYCRTKFIEMKKAQLLFATLILLGSTFLSAQTITVSGKVTSSEETEGVIGATILLKSDQSIGTTTEMDGTYSITVPDAASSVLVFSYTGFKTVEIPVDARTNIDVVMETGLFLDEVVVVGYGTQKKKVVTGSIAKVDAAELENMGVVRLEGALQGRTSGVRVTSDSGQPGAGATVRIRGTNTPGNSEPLYVVDGVPIGGGIDYLAQNDIESIEVLKDASAGIYGARSASGVILVTTKKGKAGTMSVNYNSYYGVQNPWRKLRVLNATEYATLLNEASAADGGNILFDDPESLGEGTDWQDEIFNKNAPIQSHEISLSAGNDKSTYFASISYFDQSGIVSEEDSRYKRYTLRLNSTHKVGSRFTLGNTLAYTNVESNGVSTNSEFGSPLSRAINIDPITPVYETDEDVLNSSVFTNFPVVSDENGVFAISELVTSEILNPLAALEVQQGVGHSDKLVGNIYGELEILDGLKFRTSVGADLAFWGGEGFSPVFYLNAANRNEVNSYNRSKNQGLKWIVENTLTYQKNIGDHDISLLLGASGEKNSGNGISATIQDIPATSIEDASFAYFNEIELQRAGGFEYNGTFASYFGRAIYNYKQKYLFQFVMRADGSSNFGSNNKFGYFPSVSAGWIVTDEDFLANNDNLNFLKIRASWGQNGNDRIGQFRYISTIGEGRTYTFGSGDNLVNGVSPNGISNPDLKWESTAQTNIGFDAILLKDISLTLDIYKKKTTGILAIDPVPLFVGNSPPTANIGDVENKGIDIELGWKKSKNDWDVEVFGNVTYNDNKVVFLGSEADFIPGSRVGPQGLEVTRTSVGESFNYIFGYQTDGLFQNQSDINDYVNEQGLPLQAEAKPGDIKFVDFNNDGVIDENDRTKIGDAIPDLTYGLTISARYKNFDFTVFAQGVSGNEVYNATRRFDLNKSNFNANALERWTGEGTSNSFPRMTLLDENRNFSRSSDFFVQNGSFFRIKTLQFGYNLPASMLDKVGIKKVRVYISGNNVLTFTKYEGFDSEITSGVDRGIYPQARSYMVGVNVGF